MRIEQTEIPGLTVIAPRVFDDRRGFFLESFRSAELESVAPGHTWVQDNHSRSRKGVLRGLHYSLGGGQAKLVRCARGEVFDVAVDLRRDSPTFGRWFGATLDDREHRQLYIPVGFAHGFCVVSDVADVIYKCSSYYDADLERELAWNDSRLAIEWPLSDPILSPRDRAAPGLTQIEGELIFDPPDPAA